MVTPASDDGSGRSNDLAGSLGIEIRRRSRIGRTLKMLSVLTDNKLALLGMLYLIGIGIVAIAAPVIAPYSPTVQNYEAINHAPSFEYPFGTDNYGRDVFSRVVHGSRYAMFLGIVIVGIQAIIGISLGLIAGYYGGYTESAIMRLVDITLSIPGIVLALAIAGVLGGGLMPLIIAISVVGWRGFARIVRGDVKSIMEESYINSAKAAGLNDFTIIARYILPNVAASIIVYTTLTIPSVILWSAALSFLGMGVHPPTPEWGALIAAGRGDIQSSWWIATFPGLAIMTTIIAFNAVGDGLRDALDPKEY